MSTGMIAVVFAVVVVVVVVADCDSPEFVFVAFAVAAFAVVAFAVVAFAVAAFDVVASVNTAGAVQESNLLKAPRLVLKLDVAWVAWVA